MNPKLFKPSGLNDKFMGEGLSFSDYCQQSKEIIKKARIDLCSQNAEFILQSNAPFELRPSSFKKAILLTHGLFDSPFAMRDIGNYFFSQGFLVRSILLPGHGTVPGDLINVTYSEWLKAVDYGVASLKQEAEQIYLGGFSLGGTLSLHKAMEDENIHGLFLLAPALQLSHHWLLKVLDLYILIGKITPFLKWLQRLPQEDYVKYSSLCCNSVYQINAVIKKVQHLLRKIPVKQPTFVVSTAQDETVSSKAILHFFHHLNSQSRLLLYSCDPKLFPDPRIIVKNSRLLSKPSILDFSHICLPFSPNNSHYGVGGDYRDFLHYPLGKPPESAPIFLGAVSKKNLKTHTVQRLTYNPDFEEMMQMISQFLDGTALLWIRTYLT